MTAVADAGAGSAGTSAALRAPWGTARTVLRLHRAALAVWALFVVGLSAGLVWLAEVTGKEERKALEACDSAGQDWCDMTMIGLPGYENGLRWTGLLISYLFLGVAAFAGGALTGRELENGTAHLAWTQGVSPTRWLTAKLAVPALVVTGGATALVLVYRWAWGTNEDLLQSGWMSDDGFLSRGPASVAYALCALAVGALTGLLLRRTLPALAVSVVTAGLISFVVARYRSSFSPAVTVTSAAEDFDYPLTAWQVESGALIHGHRVPNFDVTKCYGGSTATTQNCLDDLGVTGFYTTYHPESHYWPIHLVETGIVLTVAALATTAAFLLLRRRTAGAGRREA
ncbi:hypothetical protein ACIBVL_38765 [Streptomyces sp. NPDC049687]|uniref:hypothetical protein n=1 Tax=Streptomyces sp. NPDC049687 TaxID=3365596 RepID=UPI0037BAB5D7